MDKRIENATNELINAEIWSANLYLSLQVYFEEEQLPILSAWLNTQAQENMNRVYRMMDRIYHKRGSVTISELNRDAQQWETPLAALDDLLRHEQYMSKQIATILTLARNIDEETYSFISRLYANQTFVSAMLIDLLRILILEKGLRLPCLDSVAAMN